MPAKVHADHVGGFAGSERTDLVREVQRARAVDRRHRERRGRGQARSASRATCLASSAAVCSSRPEVEAVVARGAVGAERHVDTGAQQLR